jgi:hypothetical protein
MVYAHLEQTFAKYKTTGSAAPLLLSLHIQNVLQGYPILPHNPSIVEVGLAALCVGLDADFDFVSVLGSISAIVQLFLVFVRCFPPLLVLRSALFVCSAPYLAGNPDSVLVFDTPRS